METFSLVDGILAAATLNYPPPARPPHASYQSKRPECRPAHLPSALPKRGNHQESGAAYDAASSRAVEAFRCSRRCDDCRRDDTRREPVGALKILVWHARLQHTRELSSRARCLR